MGILIIGLALFVGVHLIPAAPSLRESLIARLGAGVYRMIFSLISLASIVIVVWGFSQTPIQPVYAPPVWGHALALGVVPVAFVLFASANMPTHIREFVRHPMLAGLFLWGLAHLLANGDSRTLVLFGTFLAYSAVAVISVVTREQKQAIDRKAPRWSMDIVAIVAGFVISGVVAKFHGALFGMPV